MSDNSTGLTQLNPRKYVIVAVAATFSVWYHNFEILGGLLVAGPAFFIGLFFGFLFVHILIALLKAFVRWGIVAEPDFKTYPNIQACRKAKSDRISSSNVMESASAQSNPDKEKPPQKQITFWS